MLADKVEDKCLESASSGKVEDNFLNRSLGLFLQPNLKYSPHRHSGITRYTLISICTIEPLSQKTFLYPRALNSP